VTADKRVFHLVHDLARQRAEEGVRTAPAGYEVTIKEPTRNAEQNAKFHAICGDLAKSSLTWAGRRRSLEGWKVLLVSGHATATQEECEVVEGLEGEMVNLRESTALMSVKRSSSLIEYALAYCASNNVELSQ
jgi:hypothetical protein